MPKFDAERGKALYFNGFVDSILDVTFLHHIMVVQLRQRGRGNV